VRVGFGCSGSVTAGEGEGSVGLVAAGSSQQARAKVGVVEKPHPLWKYFEDSDRSGITLQIQVHGHRKSGTWWQKLWKLFASDRWKGTLNSHLLAVLARISTILRRRISLEPFSASCHTYQSDIPQDQSEVLQKFPKTFSNKTL
jgi:hypothetical protein